MPLLRESRIQTWPIFWIHSLGGDPGGGFFHYRPLARELADFRPSYGIRCFDPPIENVRNMASRYIEAVREVEPDGPYCLGGFCFGDMAAFEMAAECNAAAFRSSW